MMAGGRQGDDGGDGRRMLGKAGDGRREARALEELQFGDPEISAPPTPPP